MSKVSMPEPVAWMIDEPNQIGGLSTKLHWARGAIKPAYGQHHQGLITTTQAEAYADARVREAFEGAIAALETCRTTGAVRNITVDACVAKVRGLIPGQHAIDAAKAKQT